MKGFIRNKLREAIELPIEVGDTILMGKFKNKKVVVKDIEWDEEKGDLKINGKPALKMRIPKKIKETNSLKLLPIYEQVLNDRLSESLVFELIDSMLDEDYPTSFDMDEFKALKSFAAKIKYCQEHLQRISSGSSRIVYKIDDEKVLKLAKNQKGLAQNEVEGEYSQYHDLSDVVARVFDIEPNNHWIEMELARKVRKADFKRITGYSFEEYAAAVHNYGIDAGSGRGFKHDIDAELVEQMWEDEFVYGIFNYVGNYGAPTGDLLRLSSYGIVHRDGQEEIVIIDYGLTSEVYDSYYS